MIFGSCHFAVRNEQFISLVSDFVLSLHCAVSAPDKVTAVPGRRNGNFQTPISVPAVRPK